MLDKLWLLIPEMCLFAGAVVVSVMGLSRSRTMRDMLALIVCISLAAAFIVTPAIYTQERVESADLLMPWLGRYVKMLVAGIGILLAMLTVGLIDRKMEASIEQGRTAFDPLRANRGEFFAFFLFSLMGVMLIPGSNDLIWLFLALELASLPTYIMIAISRPAHQAQEAAVKYFFLGAMAAATFLFGFALIYGATGTITLTEIRDVLAMQAADGGISGLAILGMVLAVLGIGFKMAAAPMHFYAPDVYEGAAAPVTAFLGFVPKTAGAVALILLLETVGWSNHLADGARGLPVEIGTTLWMMAALTMILGNIGALLQRNIKRLLAYSSIAHSGYMIIGLLAGPGLGVNALLFYLLAYGVMNTAAFAVLASLERRGEEIETLDDLAGLRERSPILAIIMALSAASLIGLPPFIGFIGKLYLFIAGIEAGQIWLVVIAALNSAISAWYYLLLAGMPLLSPTNALSAAVNVRRVIWPRVAAAITAAGIIIVPIFGQGFFKATEAATRELRDPLPGVLTQIDADDSDSKKGRQPAILE